MLEVDERGFTLLKQWLAASIDTPLAQEFCTLLWTTEELQDLSKRCLILEALLQSTMTQRAMAKTLQVSIAKITRGANELKRASPALKKFLVSLADVQLQDDCS